MFADRVARIPVRETGEYRNARADRPRPEEALATANATHELDRPGRPLPRRERESAERAFGADFARVRLHDDAAAHASAAALGARGWTWGDHVVLGHQAGPGTLMHELAHVVQQRAAVGGSASAGQPAGALEQDADHAAAERPLPSLRASGPLVQMQAESPQGGSFVGPLRRELLPADKTALDKYLSAHVKVTSAGGLQLDGGETVVSWIVAAVLRAKVAPTLEPSSIKQYVEHYVENKVRDQKIFGGVPAARPHDKTLAQKAEAAVTPPLRPNAQGGIDLSPPSNVTSREDYDRVLVPHVPAKGQSVTTPQIPMDLTPAAPPVSSYKYNGGPHESYEAGAAIDFTITPPKDSGAKRLILVAEADRQALEPLAATSLESASATSIHWPAPRKPGKYLIRVDTGNGTFDARGERVIEVPSHAK